MLIASPTAKSLMHIFFAQRSAFKVCWSPNFRDFESGEGSLLTTMRQFLKQIDLTVLLWIVLIDSNNNIVELAGRSKVSQTAG